MGARVIGDKPPLPPFLHSGSLKHCFRPRKGVGGRKKRPTGCFFPGIAVVALPQSTKLGCVQRLGWHLFRTSSTRAPLPPAPGNASSRWLLPSASRRSSRTEIVILP